MKSNYLVSLWEVFVPPPKRGILYRLVDGLYAVHVPMPTIWTSRTPLEKGLLAAGAAWCVWKAYDWKLYEYVHPVARQIVPGYKALADYFSPSEIFVETSQGLVQLESYRQNSAESRLTPPDFQCKVIRMVEGRQVLVGCAIRFPEGALVAPDHVFVKDGDEKWVVGRQGRVNITKMELIPLDADCAMIMGADFATIGVKEAKIGLIPARGAHVKVVGGEDKGTTAMLKIDHNSFGKTIYEGTTVPGYSGAAYTEGNLLLAMHQSGGNVNAGYNASYIYVLIRKYLNVRFEESTDFLMSQYKAGNKIWAKEYGVDEVFVEINGKYHLMDVGNVNKVFGDAWKNSDGFIQGKRIQYDDSEPECVEKPSGEENNSKNPGALSTSERNQDIVQDPVQALMSAYIKLPKKLQRSFRQLTNTSQMQQPTTDGQNAQTT